MRVVRLLCRCRNKTNNDMFLFLSFCFLPLCFAFLCFFVREEVNGEGKRAKREILRNAGSKRDDGRNGFGYKVYRMTRQNSKDETRYGLIWCCWCYLSRLCNSWLLIRIRLLRINGRNLNLVCKCDIFCGQTPNKLCYPWCFDIYVTLGCIKADTLFVCYCHITKWKWFCIKIHKWEQLIQTHR